MTKEPQYLMRFRCSVACLSYRIASKGKQKYGKFAEISGSDWLESQQVFSFRWTKGNTCHFRSYTAPAGMRSKALWNCKDPHEQAQAYQGEIGAVPAGPRRYWHRDSRSRCRRRHSDRAYEPRVPIRRCQRMVGGRGNRCRQASE
jgi:hypothetical protein